MDLRVEDEAMKSLVSEAIVNSLTPDARTALIKEAVLAALKVETGSYDKRSAIQRAFDRAVENAAEKYAMEMLSEEEGFQDNLKTLFEDVASKLFSDNRDQLVESICTTIRNALTKDRY